MLWYGHGMQGAFNGEVDQAEESETEEEKDEWDWSNK